MSSTKSASQILSNLERSGMIPEGILKESNTKRTKLAAEYAKKDAPILDKKEEELLPLYEELAFSICTDRLLDKCFSGCTAEQRWAMVEPMTYRT